MQAPLVPAAPAWVMRIFACLIMVAAACRGCLAADLRADDFGVRADGRTDDGPAILKMVERARTRDGEPVRLVFPEGKTIYAATGKERYLFPLQGTKNVTVEGGGSTFLLHPHIRFANLDFAERPTLKNLNVDFTPHPFIETVIEEVDPKRQFVDVRVLNPGEAGDLGGPTKEDGEQWFGGFVWCENGEHPKAARHYAVKGTETCPDGRVRIFYDGASFSRTIADNIKPGATHFSVPRPGVAHRHGPGALFDIHDTTDARLERIRVWGAPWFVFSIYRNSGRLDFIDVDVEPRPGTNRLMSACRDAFHVTANRAKLLFDGCDTSGLGDDDYNFCILSSTIHEVLSPTQIVIRQKFPIQYNPMRVGETLMVMDDHSSMIGRAKIARYEEKPLKDDGPIRPGGRCPEVTIVLDRPIEGLEKGLTVWSAEAANPDTTMRNCSCSFSCRMQTSLTIERCRFVCYNVSYGMSAKNANVEGPGPDRMKIVDSEFRIGRGSGYHSNCGGSGPLDRCRTREITIEGCTFRAPLKIVKARAIHLKDNQFHDEVGIGEHEKLEMTGNTRDGKPFKLQ